VDSSPDAALVRLRSLLTAVRDALAAGVAVSRAVHAEHGWNPLADRHLDHQLVRREAMERLKPWDADLDDPHSELTLGRQLDLFEPPVDNLGLPMSGLIVRTPADVLRIWHSDDGELPAAATVGLRAFYRQAPSRQTQLTLGVDEELPAREHLALLWADGRTPETRGRLVRFDLVRPRGTIGRRVEVDWHVDLLARLRTAA
jgi:hypothetical protein